MNRWILTNIRPWGEEACHLLIDGSHIAAHYRSDDALPELPTVDGGGAVALPGFVNAHAHIDKSWWGKAWQSWGGEPSLEGRIQHERARREELDIPSVAVCKRVLQEFLRHGTTRVRTHIDVDLGVELRGIEAARQANAELGDPCEMAIVAFPQDGVIRRPGVVELLRKAAKDGVEYIGGLDPASIDRDPVGQLDALFDIAADYGCGIDIHLHETGSLGQFDLELIMDRIEKYGLHGKVTLAHGFVIPHMPAFQRQEVLARMAELKMSATTVAPVRSPQFSLTEFTDAGVPFAFGTDGIRDLWAPYGDGDILSIAWQYGRGAGIVRDNDLLRVLRIATVEGARFVSDTPNDLSVGSRADIVTVQAENPMDALVRRVPRALVIAGGTLIDTTNMPQPWA